MIWESTKKNLICNETRKPGKGWDPNSQFQFLPYLIEVPGFRDEIFSYTKKDAVYHTVALN